ncbi:twin arginine protein translocation system -TatC protein [Gammaproteobacteria bacterium]
MSSPSGKEQPFLSHLIELRSRLLRMLLAVLLATLAMLPFANPLYTWIAQPLMQLLPPGSSMIATEVAAPFMVPFKLTLVLSVFLVMPYLLYEVWAFVAPGLYRHERGLVLPLVVSSAFLYYLGMAFAYFLVFPIVFGFFVTTAPQGVAVMTDINKYLDFVFTLFFSFGIAFEVPVATVLLVWTGVVHPDDLAGKRSYIIVAAFTIGMILTPPDVLSQTMLALPMWCLFELGLYASRWLLRRKAASAIKVENPEEREADLETQLEQAMAEEAKMKRFTREGADQELKLLGKQGPDGV